MRPRDTRKNCNKHEQEESRWYDVEEKVKCGTAVGKW